MPNKSLPTGICPKCGKLLDDHDGWLLKLGPYCRKAKKDAIRNKAGG